MGRYKNNKDGTKTLIAGRGNTDTIESQIGYVEATDTAISAHAVGSYFINKTGQFVKTTSAIAVGDTIAVGTNCQATDIAGVLKELNSKIIPSAEYCTPMLQFNTGSFSDIDAYVESIPQIVYNAVLDDGATCVFGFSSAYGGYGCQIAMLVVQGKAQFRNKVYPGNWSNWQNL